MSKINSGNLVVHPLPYSLLASHWFAQIRHLELPVLLTSGSSSHPSARFDILTADPHCILRTKNQLTLVSKAGIECEATLDNPFKVIAKYCPVQSDDLPDTIDLPFTGGAIGYFGYELLHTHNNIQSTQTAMTAPDMLVGIYDWALIIDHKKQETSVIFRDCHLDRQQLIIAKLLNKNAPIISDFFLKCPFVSNFSKQQYLDKFNRIIEYINAGDCYQVNLAQCFTAQCQGDSWSAFLKLQQHANAPFSAFLEDGANAVLCFSPERFLQVLGDSVLTQPIKGTRPRSKNLLEDAANRLDLETSLKDKAENLMIVDLLRNDLGRVCEIGSVNVQSLFETQSFTNVHHLVSTISGKLDKPELIFELLAACFPGGSITGTPKLRAMQIINELETRQRSVYCGAIAYIDHRGNMDSNIAIRTLVRENDTIHCWGGGGIVADSNGDAEFQETLDKISMLINNL